MSGKNNGGIVQRVTDGGIANISNCLFAPSSIATADNNSQVILNWNSSSSFSIQKCYYNSVGGDNYGTSNGGEAAATDNDLLLADLGSGWEISGGNVVPKMNMPVPDIVNPVFTGVTINAAAPTEVTSNDGNVNFLGQYSPFSIDDSNIKSVILLTSGNKLGYAKNARTMNAFRAHFYVPTTAAAREFVLNFGEDNDENTTGIIEVNTNNTNLTNKAEGIFDLQGRKVANPSKGLYIVNGRKVIIK